MDSGWLKALELPAKITGGIFAGCVVALYLDTVGTIILSQIGAWLRPSISVAAVFSGTMFLAGILNELVMALRAWLAKSKADAAALADQSAKEASIAEAKAKALAHLDTLSEEEVYIVAKALDEGSPSIKWWFHSGGAAQLVHKGLLDQLPGEYMTEHWPYTFRDFAWQAMLLRKDEYLKRSADLEASRKKRR